MTANANALASEHFGIVELFDALGDGVVYVAGDGDDEVAVADFVFDLVAAVAGDAVRRYENAVFEEVLLEFCGDGEVGGIVAANERV